ncbi:MAG: aminotransferase class IV, partial [Gammaproteobacteria bacterium]|nr:aminotransferase class IV [Gammaproteobacteria bacterium]
MNNESGRVVYMNGNFVNEKDAKISIYDSALMFGDMVFEMTRSFNKKQFKLREHLERLYTGINILRIPMSMSIEQMEKACNETIERNEQYFSENDEHRLMINVSRGPLGIYAPIFGGKMEPTVVIADFPLKWTVAAMAPLFDSGINAIIPSQRAIPASLM